LTLRSLKSLRALASQRRYSRARTGPCIDSRNDNQRKHEESNPSLPDPGNSAPPSIYKNIVLNNVKGTLTLTSEMILFQPKKRQSVVKQEDSTWGWDALQKHLICAAPITADDDPKKEHYLLKLVVKNNIAAYNKSTTKTLSLRYPDRTALDGIHADVIHRLQWHSQKSMRQKYQKTNETLLRTQRRLKEANRAIDELQDTHQTLLDTCELLARKGTALKTSHEALKVQHLQLQQFVSEQKPEQQVVVLQSQVKSLQQALEKLQHERTAREIEHEMDLQEYKSKAETLERQLLEEQMVTEQLLEERQALDEMVQLDGNVSATGSTGAGAVRTGAVSTAAVSTAAVSTTGAVSTGDKSTSAIETLAAKDASFDTSASQQSIVDFRHGAIQDKLRALLLAQEQHISSASSSCSDDDAGAGAGAYLEPWQRRATKVNNTHPNFDSNISSTTFRRKKRVQGELAGKRKEHDEGASGREDVSKSPVATTRNDKDDRNRNKGQSLKTNNKQAIQSTEARDDSIATEQNIMSATTSFYTLSKSVVQPRQCTSPFTIPNFESPAVSAHHKSKTGHFVDETKPDHLSELEALHMLLSCDSDDDTSSLLKIGTNEFEPSGLASY